MTNSRKTACVKTSRHFSKEFYAISIEFHAKVKKCFDNGGFVEK
jgi:hypothetical protein